MLSTVKLFVEGRVGKVNFKHHIADLQCSADGTTLKVLQSDDLKFEQESSCTLERLWLDFNGLTLPVELRGAPFSLSTGDSQRLCDISISVGD